MNELPKLDLTQLRELCDGDTVFFNEMINTFIRTSHEGMEQLRRAMQEGNRSRVSDLAHKLRGPCSHLGMEELRRIFADMETGADGTMPLVQLENLLTLAEKETGMVLPLIEKEIIR